MLKRMPLHGWIGVGLLLAGVAIYGGWASWMATRTWVPLEMPVSLARGHVRSPEFKINVEAGFWLFMDVETKPDPDAVSCLIGYRDEYCRKNNIGELRASWTLSDSGRVVAQGSTEKYTGVRGGMVSKARGLGEFVVPKGDHYVLDVDFPDDNSRFDAGHPALIAQNYYWGYEDERAPVFFLAIFVFAIGAGLLVSAIGEPYIKRRNEVISLQTAEPPPGSLAQTEPEGSETAATSARSRSFWIGLALVIAGLATFCAVAHWYNSRIFTPVNIPVSLATGHFRTGPFRINVEESYTIWIDLDPRQPLDPMCSSYMLLQTKGVVSRDGQVADRWDIPARDVGLERFGATKGIYDVDIEVLPGAECLNAAHPRLRIFTDRQDYQFYAALFEWPALFCVFVGLSLIIFSRWTRRSEAPGVSLNLSPSVGQNFQWAQRMPLHRPIGGLPGFGVTAGIIYALTAMIMMFSIIPLIPLGMPVHLLKPGQAPPKSDEWTEPLIVMLKDLGPGKRPELLVNAKHVEWEDLNSVLRQELGRRKDWVVYVGGDDALAYANVTDVIDAARKYGAKVYLITRK